MLPFLSHWWRHHKSKVGKCAFITLGVLVWYAGRELMHRQRVPFLSAPDPSQPGDHHDPATPAEEA